MRRPAARDDTSEKKNRTQSTILRGITSGVCLIAALRIVTENHISYIDPTRWGLTEAIVAILLLVAVVSGGMAMRDVWRSH